ncbi:MAG TPA: D-hexose-6-phosphate mutarotase, partial [Longimicrobiaceae bacterium]|nr:D-hexose-6-phosphate mutarotase [Longimicrobiaceae bacterium]
MDEIEEKSGDQEDEGGTGSSAGVIVTAGRAGMPKVVLRHPSGAAAELYLHGAHLTSWRTAEGEELLFLSEQAVFAPQAGIRGGIPIVFPQFGPGELPQHGFARFQEWTLEESGSGEADSVFARLALRDNEETRSQWPHPFLAEVSVLLTDSLEVELAVTNTGNSPFSFTAALHTYFRVSNVRETTVEGLRGIRYRDKVQGGVEVLDMEDAVRFRGETDRVYLDAPSTARIRDAANGRTIELRKEGFDDLVVWNPWIEWSRSKQDFGDEEYLRMVCGEAAQVGDPVRLDPGQSWRAVQT